MKLTVLFLTVGFLNVAAKGVSQNVTFSGNKVPLQKVLSVVEEQTGYFIFYNSVLLQEAKPITIEAQNVPLQAFMDRLLSDQELTYTIESKSIIISRKLVAEGLNPRVISPQLHGPPITGVVRDSTGAPLSGATVYNKRTKKSVQTDGKGEFEIEGEEGDVLTLSFIGFDPQNIRVTGNSVLAVLRVSTSPLDEVQIQAYGTTSRRLSTGNISTVKAEQIEKQPVNNPVYALQGRVAGLQISPTTGLPGGRVDVKIRGKNTLRSQFAGSADPLFVIDGLPVTNTITGLGGPGGLIQFSALSFINPQDIESIEVLKDADATSIYGSRGANGVILITTKKGNVGSTKLDINIQTGITNVAKKLDLMNTDQFLRMRREAYSNAGINIASLTPDISNADVTHFSQSSYTDWQKKLIGNTGKYNDFQGSFSGGASLVQYFVGANFHKETSVLPGKNYNQRGGGRMSLTGTSQNQKFKSIISASLFLDKNTLPGTDLTSQTVYLPPNSPAPYKEDGGLNWQPLPSGGRSWNNPYSTLFQTYEAKVNNLITSADIRYEFSQHFELKTQLGYNETWGSSFRKVSPFAGRNPEEANYPAIAAFNTNGVRNFSIEPQLNYNTSLGRGRVNVLIGSSYQSTNTQDQSIFALGFTSDALLKNIGSATSTYVFNNATEYKYAALFGRVSYDWDHKYLINITARRDGSSRFGPGKQFGNFGSAGIAWIFGKEEFIRKVFPIMSYGKIRFSYGSTGNDGISDYAYLERYQIVDGNPYQGAKGYASSGLFNSYYAWEVTKKMEFGLETGFLKDRFLFTINYFRNRSGNQLLDYPYPSMAGPGNPKFNLPALIQNMGVEFVTHTENIVGRKFSWSTDINLTINRNKLLKFDQLSTSPYYAQYEIGKPFTGVERVYKFGGVNPGTGIYQFLTIDGKEVADPIDPSRLDYGKYLRIMTDPKFFGGISNTIKYGNISVDFLLQFVKQVGRNPLYQNSVPGQDQTIQFSEVDKHWRQPGDQSSFQKVYAGFNFELYDALNKVTQSDVGFVNASFVRLKNLSISYVLPNKVKERLRLQAVRVYAQGQNLLTITKYKGLDPETQSISSLPPLRVITIGMQITL